MRNVIGGRHCRTVNGRLPPIANHLYADAADHLEQVMALTTTTICACPEPNCVAMRDRFSFNLTIGQDSTVSNIHTVETVEVLDRCGVVTASGLGA